MNKLITFIILTKLLMEGKVIQAFDDKIFLIKKIKANNLIDLETSRRESDDDYQHNSSE